ncbi:MULTISPECIES: SPOR domain-containing protein [Halocynthiibacter]|uniref:SPOR domain-containing protein n=1 Tax=Halocynthiibacter halioticoli TaxID=2986804 RepID=A0AAE3LRW5_9RHOB|nr:MULTISPECIES: SPOR domain-containing protein [Halocynthiibacter]MCV6824894.1 SPOR domain-containing protein [Halocynthiibacter halioticoli]MCW4057895.1 SPOR domain-containing protein [Halocynthiibacter sp. SDUM655004]
MAVSSFFKVAVCVSAVVGLSACQEGAGSFLSQDGDVTTTESGAKVVEKDVEAPEVFSVQEVGLWDGRPSLGGIWVAHPTAVDPERVMIRNEANGQSVIGALFRKERETPGPKLQVSSEAAEAIGMIAGSPQELSVVAMRRKEIVVEPAPAPVEAEKATSDAPIEGDVAPIAANEVEQTTLDPIASAAAALDAVEDAGKPTNVASAADSSGKSQYIQIGIFSVEANANSVADQMRKAGATPKITTFSNEEKQYWRVIVGPVSSAAEKDALKKKVVGMGYSDAFFVNK